MADQRSRSRSSSSSTPHLLAAIALGVALASGLGAARGLTVPPEVDHYRDIGAAQGLLDGSWGGDPAYAGERWWYPPLLPALTATLSRATGLPLPALYVRLGPYLNLLGAAAFYLLGCALLAAWPALLALIAYLFIGTWTLPSWGQATYSPWLWPVFFVQVLAFSTAAAWLTALRTGRRRWDVATGVLLGLTFLGHAAPALILAAAITLGELAALRAAPRDPRRGLQRLFVVGGLSALLALPFLAPLALRYHLRMVNLVPGRLVTLGGRDMLKAHLAPRFAGAVLGALVLLRGRLGAGAAAALAPAVGARPDDLGAESRRVLACLMLAAAGLGAYALLAQVLEPHGIVLPLFAPAFHFHFYLTAFECLLFGVGLWAAARWAAERVADGGRLRADRRPAVARGLAVGAAALLAAAALPAYGRRADVTLWPERARRWGGDAELGALYRWARQRARPDDVVLADDHWGLFGVVAAGHHVVALDDAMSNPYVSRVERARDRDAMFAALRAGRRDDFQALARRYGVTHVISAPDTIDGCCGVGDGNDPPPGMTTVLREGSLRVYAVGALADSPAH